MKLTNIQTILTLATLGMVIALIVVFNQNSAAQNTARAEPQIVVVTATPQPEPVNWTVTEETTEEVEVSAVAPTTEPTTVPLPTKAGTLLQDSNEDTFYLTAEGTRLHIYSEAVFDIFGFAKEDVVRVDDEALQDIPLAGELSQLLQDTHGNLFWLSGGKLWVVDTWKSVVARKDYAGPPVTPLDESLQKLLPIATRFGNGTLLQADGRVYHLRHNTIVPVMIDGAPVIATAEDQTPVIAAVADINFAAAEIIDVPAGMLEAYNQNAWRLQVVVEFNDETLAANLRQGPGLDYDVVKIITRGEGQITAKAKTEDDYWLFVEHQDEQGWLAMDLIKKTAALKLLPYANHGESTPAQETTTAEKSELQPVYCNETPIRGFGKVWGDHLDVQHTLGCPWGRERGTNAAVQHFQNGLMLWLEADSAYNSDPVYVFFNDGTYQCFGDLGAADPAKVGSVPAGFQPVGDKFSKVYWEGTGARVKERLGYATSSMSDSAGAFQQFSNGRMFWAGEIDSIFVIYDYYNYENDQSTHVRTWENYEDKF